MVDANRVHGVNSNVRDGVIQGGSCCSVDSNTDKQGIRGENEMKGISPISPESIIIMVVAMIAPAMSEDVSTGADVGDVALIYDCWAGCEDSPCYLDGCCDGEQNMYGVADVFEVVS